MVNYKINDIIRHLKDYSSTNILILRFFFIVSWLIDEVLRRFNYRDVVYQFITHLAYLLLSHINIIWQNIKYKFIYHLFYLKQYNKPYICYRSWFCTTR